MRENLMCIKHIIKKIVNKLSVIRNYTLLYDKVISNSNPEYENQNQLVRKKRTKLGRKLYCSLTTRMKEIQNPGGGEGAPYGLLGSSAP